MSERSIGLLCATTTALCWAVLAIGLKYALQFADSGTIVWFRMIVASLLLVTYYLIKKPDHLKILKQLPMLGVVAGLCLSANYYGYMKGVELTSPSNAQIMIQMAPMSLILIGIFYFRERPSPLQGLGFGLAALGFSLFFWDQITVAVSNQDRFFSGNLWIVMAAATWALFATLQKILTRVWTPQQINLLIYILAVFVLAPLADFKILPDLGIGAWALMIFLGVNTLVAYGALGEALKRIPASHVSVIISANPLLTITIMTILRYQQVQWIETDIIDWRGYMGATLVVTGVICAVRKAKD
ncbi:MAG: DMT family transporter [Bdellovibrionales bacterium]|nr:DMT family transporter [Bdellovibrionales bacterium]